MGNNTVTGKATEAALAEKLIAGAQKHFASVATLAFASASFTPAQVEAQLQQLATLRTDVDAAKAALKAKLAAEAVQAPALRTLMRAFVQFVKTTFSNSPDVLTDFGISPKKARTPLTVEQKAAATAKAAATRKARGTKGTKQLQGIHGDVIGVEVTPVTAPKPEAAVASNGPSAQASDSKATGATVAPTPHG